MSGEDKAKQARELLSDLLGLRLVGTQNFFATRHFYFGEPTSGGDVKNCYTLGIECAWRIESDQIIVVGSEDYYVKAENNLDPEWEEGMASGHLQDQKLRELLGEVKAGDMVNAGSGLVVESVEADRYGGLRIGLTEGLSVSVFPASNTQMEWILMRPGGGGLVLMNGLLNRTRRKPHTPRI